MTPRIHVRLPRPTRFRARKLPFLLALPLAVAGLVTLGAGAAQAGGTPSASCPGGATTPVSSPYASPYPGQAAHLDAGFYAHISSFWPPYTKNVCRTTLGFGHPVIHPSGTGCPAGWHPYGIPNDIPSSFGDSPPVTWGTFLPTGWYALGDDSGFPWTTVCWSPTDPSHPAP